MKHCIVLGHCFAVSSDYFKNIDFIWWALFDVMFCDNNYKFMLVVLSLPFGPGFMTLLFVMLLITARGIILFVKLLITARGIFLVT